MQLFTKAKPLPIRSKVYVFQDNKGEWYIDYVRLRADIKAFLEVNNGRLHSKEKAPSESRDKNR